MSRTNSLANLAEPKMFYVLSLKWTKRRDGVLTWWRLKSCGYVFRIEEAQRFTEAEIAARPALDDGDRALAVPCEAVDALLVPVGEVESPTIDAARARTDRVVRFEDLAAVKLAGGCAAKLKATRAAFKKAMADNDARLRLFATP